MFRRARPLEGGKVGGTQGRFASRPRRAVLSLGVASSVVVALLPAPVAVAAPLASRPTAIKAPRSGRLLTKSSSASIPVFTGQPRAHQEDTALRGASVAAATSCPPNSEDSNLESANRCVAETMLQTRGFIKKPVSPLTTCLTEPRALMPGATYSVGECKGNETYQAEAVTQARMIAQMDRRGVYADGPSIGGISANLQWEVKLPPTRRPSRKTVTPAGACRALL